MLVRRVLKPSWQAGNAATMRKVQLKATNKEENQPLPDKVAAKEELLDFMESKSKKVPAKPRKLTIRGETPDEPDSKFAQWEAWKPFPEGFEQMNFSTKLNELYMGRRGFMFWINKVAYTGSFVLLGLWVAFRFIGPNLGLYQLNI